MPDSNAGLVNLSWQKWKAQGVISIKVIAERPFNWYQLIHIADMDHIIYRYSVNIFTKPNQIEYIG